MLTDTYQNSIWKKVKKTQVEYDTSPNSSGAPNNILQILWVEFNKGSTLQTNWPEFMVASSGP